MLKWKRPQVHTSSSISWCQFLASHLLSRFGMAEIIVVLRLSHGVPVTNVIVGIDATVEQLRRATADKFTRDLNGVRLRNVNMDLPLHKSEVTLCADGRLIGDNYPVLYLCGFYMAEVVEMPLSFSFECCLTVVFHQSACLHCSAPWPQYRCSKCSRRYCSRACQHAHWQVHKAACRRAFAL